MPASSLPAALNALAASLGPGTRIAARLSPGRMELDMVYLPPSLRGQGSLVMAQILEAASLAGVEVGLKADPTDEPEDPSQFELVRWYHSFGFKIVGADDDSVSMHLPATGPTPAAVFLARRAQAPRLTQEQYQHALDQAPSVEPAPSPARPGPR